MADFSNFLYRLMEFGMKLVWHVHFPPERKTVIRREKCSFRLVNPKSGAKSAHSGAQISNPARKERRLARISQFLACDRGLWHRKC